MLFELTILLLDASRIMFVDFFGEFRGIRWVSCRSEPEVPVLDPRADMLSIRLPGFGCFAFCEMMTCWPNWWTCFVRFFDEEAISAIRFALGPCILLFRYLCMEPFSISWFFSCPLSFLNRFEVVPWMVFEEDRRCLNCSC